MTYPTMISANFDPERPYGVVKYLNDDDPQVLATVDCPRCAEEEYRYLYNFHNNLTIVELRPIPTKGAFGGWRIAPGSRKPCRRAPRMAMEDWPND